MNIALPQFQYRTVPQAQDRRCQVVTLSWGREAELDQYVHLHPDSTIFHTLSWRNAVGKSFQHGAQYLVALRGDRMVGLLPMFMVRGPIIGRMLVSIPYAVGGGMLVDDAEESNALFAEACRRAAELQCKMIELRSEKAGVASIPVIEHYVGFERELPASSDEVAQWLPRKARAVVRNARDKYGLTCEFSNDLLPVVWDLYCRNMRRLASINYPFRFFENLLVEFRDQCWLCVVRRGDRPLAGLMTFLFRDRVLPYFFGCEAEARACGAANFIYSCVMERAVDAGYRVFDFGRSRRDNQGSVDFKRFHGFEPRPLAYQRHFVEAKKALDLTPTNPAFGLARRIWPHLPLTVTRPAGALLSRYIPG